MASLVKWNNESEGYNCADVRPEHDDTRSINKDCTTVEHWQSQLIHSLKQSGWTNAMLLQLTPHDTRHWFIILQHEGLAAVEPQTEDMSIIVELCKSRRHWMGFACVTLLARQWSYTMISKAWSIPKSNIYRLVALVSGSDANSVRHGNSTETATT